MAKWTGWHYDHANGRLGMYYKGHLAAYLNDNGITGVDVDAGFGGGVSDPLVIGAVQASDYLAVGASPATSGGIRLAEDTYVVGRDIAHASNGRLIGLAATGNVTIDLDGRSTDFGILGSDAGQANINGRKFYATKPMGSDLFNIFEQDAGGLNLANYDAYFQYGVGISFFQPITQAGAISPDTDNAYSLGIVGKTWGDIYANHLTGIEVSDPSAPAANSGILYFRDNGGKTELVCRFPTGAVQRLAIEP